MLLNNMMNNFDNPERLRTLFELKKGCTIFCDIDGSITQHENVSDYSKDLVVLDGAIEKMDEWYKDNAYVVLTTSRKETDRDKLIKSLAAKHIKYDALLMGLPPGPRHLINDKKPYSNVKMAKAHEVKRDVGIRTIGHSFAAVNVKNDTIEKTIPEDANQTTKNKFEWQYKTMYDLGQLESIKHAIPKVFDFTPTKFHIEYLEDYKGVHEFDSYQRNQILPYVLSTLKGMYLHEYETAENSSRDWDEWFTNFIDAKIYAKKNDLLKYDLDISIFDDMKNYLESNYYKVKPSFFARYFHGDSTYENILFKDFHTKFIDFDSDYAWGPIELDMGKLTQSIITKYESWSNPETAIEDTDEEFEQVLDAYHDLIKSDYMRSKAYFYCIIHLIRMIPYQAQRDVKRCHIALGWVKKLFAELQTIED